MIKLIKFRKKFVKKNEKIKLKFYRLENYMDDSTDDGNRIFEYSQRDLRDITKNVCKPCWELKYCPYGYLVEMFPLPSIPRHRAIEHNDYLRDCLKNKTYGIDKKKLDKFREKMFNNDVKNFNEFDYPNSIPDELVYMACSDFGHICPVFFCAEFFTETEEFRSQSRVIPRSVLMRVVRRDENTCQLCSKKLLDKDIHIDHIIPLSKGGATIETNLRVLCPDCNLKKSSNSDEILNEHSKFTNRMKYYKK